MKTEDQTDGLLRFSARIGADPLLVQASSGNTSLKRNGTLWIKASGKWLADAGQKDIFVPVNQSECLENLKAGRPLAGFNDSRCAQRLRPSIETLMHVVLPQRFVIHVHSVNTLAWAVRSDAPARLGERLSGLRWVWIPYVSSGLPLAREVQMASIKRPEADVFILGNHGLVICGDSCDGAESLLAEVERRLTNPPRAARDANLSVLERVRGVSSWRLPELDKLHALGTDPLSREMVRRGVLYPCQAIFLGPDVAMLSEVENVSEARTPFLIVEGAGVLINSNITATEQAVLNGFAELVRRIEVSAPIRYLTDDEVNSLMGAEGDRYRISCEDGARLHSGDLRTP